MNDAVTNYSHSRKDKQKRMELEALLFGFLNVPGSNVGRSLHHAEMFFVVLMQNTCMVSLDRGSASKVDDVTALPSHIQDGGYALLWQRYDNNKMAAICYYVNVMATTRWRLCVTMETL